MKYIMIAILWSANAFAVDYTISLNSGPIWKMKKTVGSTTTVVGTYRLDPSGVNFYDQNGASFGNLLSILKSSPTSGTATFYPVSGNYNLYYSDSNCTVPFGYFSPNSIILAKIGTADTVGTFYVSGFSSSSLSSGYYQSYSGCNGPYNSGTVYTVQLYTTNSLSPTDTFALSFE